MTKISEISRNSSASLSDDDEETRVRKFAKHMLKSSLFIGTFLEKRLVEPLNSYRDVIKICDDEHDLIANLKAVRKRCLKHFTKNVWIGITEPKTIGAPAGYNLWVSLDEEVFGSFWYKIKNVEFFHNEVRVKLEVVRPVREKTPVHNITPTQIFEDVSQKNLGELGAKFQEFFKDQLRNLFTETLTWPNIKQATIFMVLLLSTLITFLIHTIKYLLDYLLKLLRETQGLIRVCTPIIVNFMTLISNTICGFYSLLAVLWRNRSPPINQLHISPYDVPYYRSNMRALPYQAGDFQRYRKSRGSSVKITPLD
ncbi:uncharacterized protein LOC656577 [Tribolium castaneum]|uniref:Uncharacterized protein n=1 Tax=Tribolium castaneum TaxID=7070 RepID=D6WA46_TRICA|nr:PREDICTED: uncharacterized protein LOC656577 [Tribolium castaneum]XP_968191.1 PREDICTED: uncharacterized protein LOC656577 [Tribolium castaneum]EEZ98585.1 hypothetical protein TcasGA2_TC001099 [Tribolium castaneum]|eukprot:XP_008201511.1 PREDICTED: uncharacterized protein LOC656577 [Tribolium castaneum]